MHPIKRPFVFQSETVTIQETKAPKNIFLNETVFVQKITGSGSQETVSIYNASNVEEQVLSVAA